MLHVEFQNEGKPLSYRSSEQYVETQDELMDGGSINLLD